MLFYHKLQLKTLAVLSPEKISYNEVPATDVKLPHYKIDEVEIFSSISHGPLWRQSSCSSFLTPRNQYWNEDLMSLPIYKSTSPFLLCSPYLQQFLNNIKIRYSDVTDGEYLQLWYITIERKHCTGTQRNDNGKIATLLGILLQPIAKFQTQSPSNFSIHYWEKLENYAMT